MKVKSIFLGILFGLTIWVIFPYVFIRLSDYLGLPVVDYFPLKIIGSILLFLFLIIVLYLALIFKLIGKGTPVPIEPPKKLVIRSFYKHTRNPMYLSHLMIFIGEFFIFGRLLLLLYLVLAFTAFHLLVTKWEEPQLIKRFSKDYSEYLNKVPRWM